MERISQISSRCGRLFILVMTLLLLPIPLLSYRPVSGDTSASSESYTQSERHIKSKLDMKAEEEAGKILAQFFTECGDSYVIYKYNKVVYYRDAQGSTPPFVKETWSRLAEVSVNVSPWKLTDADYRNDFEWKGMVSYSCKSQRDYIKTIGSENKESLTAWDNGTTFLSIELSKKKSAGWDVNYYGPFAVQRSLMVGPGTVDWANIAPDKYKKDQFEPCSEAEKKEVLDLDAKTPLCFFIGPVNCNEIRCEETRYKKVECSQVPEKLLQ